MRAAATLALLAALCGCGGAQHGMQLSWDASTTPSVTEYFVFRDGAQVGQTDADAFFDPAPAGMHVWYVTAYNGEQSPPSNTFEGSVP